jgi:hypothetical protein
MSFSVENILVNLLLDFSMNRIEFISNSVPKQGIMKYYIQKGRNPNGSINMKHTYMYSTVHTQERKQIKEQKVHGARGTI